MKCCLCGKIIKKDSSGWDKGHNPEPLPPRFPDYGYRCCKVCNDKLVIPARLSYLVTRDTALYSMTALRHFYRGLKNNLIMAVGESERASIYSFIEGTEKAYTELKKLCKVDTPLEIK